MNDLLGKVSIVTGSAEGIGKEIALRLARDGSDVIIVDIQKDLAQKTVKEIQPLGRKSVFIEADVSQWDQVRAMVDEVLRNFKKIDILINNAGIVGQTVPVLEYPEEDWQRVMDVNIKGVFLCCKSVLPSMIKEKKGRIVNLASIAGKEGNPKQCAYNASKAGVIAFTKGLAKEVAEHNIIVHCVSPAITETRLILGMDPELRKRNVSKIPLGRMGKPWEVAALVKFLVSEECSFSTGQCYDISGGRAVY